MKFLLLSVLISGMVLAEDEPKVTPPSPEQACKLFVDVQRKLEKHRADNFKRSVIILSGITLASVSLGSVINFTVLDNEKHQIDKITKMIKHRLSPQELADFEYYKKSNFKKLKRKNLKRMVKLLVASTGVGTAVALGADALSEGSIKAALKNMADDFVPPLGDGTMTARYASEPEEFMELNKIDACAHLASKESASAPLLRQAVLEIHELLSEEEVEDETSDVAINSSDASINTKADLPTGPSLEKTKKNSAKAE